MDVEITVVGFSRTLRYLAFFFITLRALGLDVSPVDAQVVFERVPPLRLQQGDAGGSILGAGDGFRTQGYLAAARGRICKYFSHPLGEKFGGCYLAIA